METAVTCARVALTTLIPTSLIYYLHRTRNAKFASRHFDSSISLLFLLSNLLLTTAFFSRTLFLSLTIPTHDDVLGHSQDVEDNASRLRDINAVFVYGLHLQNASISSEYRFSLTLFPIFFSSVSMTPLIIYVFDPDALSGALHEWLLESFEPFHEERLGVVVWLFMGAGSFTQAWWIAGRFGSKGDGLKNLRGMGVVMMAVAVDQAIRQAMVSGGFSYEGEESEGFRVCDMALGGSLLTVLGICDRWLQRRHRMSRDI